MATKHYSDKPIDKWTVNDFIKYFDDEHQRRFGVPYLPMRGWPAERGLIGTVVGTTKKEGKYPKEVVKEFIDFTLTNYKPSAQYPGTSFMFLYTYRISDMAPILKRYNQRISDESETIDGREDMSAWFNS